MRLTKCRRRVATGSEISSRCDILVAEGLPSASEPGITSRLTTCPYSRRRVPCDPYFPHRRSKSRRSWTGPAFTLPGDNPSLRCPVSGPVSATTPVMSCLIPSHQARATVYPSSAHATAGRFPPYRLAHPIRAVLRPPAPQLPRSRPTDYPCLHGSSRFISTLRVQSYPVFPHSAAPIAHIVSSPGSPSPPAPTTQLTPGQGDPSRSGPYRRPRPRQPALCLVALPPVNSSRRPMSGQLSSLCVKPDLVAADRRSLSTPPVLRRVPSSRTDASTRRIPRLLCTCRLRTTSHSRPCHV